jgi:hypothetical protein
MRIYKGRNSRRDVTRLADAIFLPTVVVRTPEVRGNMGNKEPTADEPTWSRLYTDELRIKGEVFDR